MPLNIKQKTSIRMKIWLNSIPGKLISKIKLIIFTISEKLTINRILIIILFDKIFTYLLPYKYIKYMMIKISVILFLLNISSFSLPFMDKITLTNSLIVGRDD